jgi:pyruvate-formate lyase-activating enzyme
MKFSDPNITADGKPRAYVEFGGYETVWFNTGTLCNLACKGCYIESSPTNDALVYISISEFKTYLNEIHDDALAVKTIAFTGGEPFMNPDMIPMLELALSEGFDVLMLTNAMRPMEKQQDALLALQALYGNKLAVRVSIDHYTQAMHEEIRGPRAWGPMLKGLKWLSKSGFNVSVAGRTLWNQGDVPMRTGYAKLFATENINVDASDIHALTLFPEMDEAANTPEATTACWTILGSKQEDMMCHNSRMVVKLKGDDAPSVAACTLLPYDPEFNFGRTLKDASCTTKLNHPHCVKFCMMSGGSCS